MMTLSIKTILIINMVVALMNFILRMVARKYGSAVITTVIIILAPIIGPFYLLFSWLFYFLFLKNRKDDINLDELSMRKDKIKVIGQPNTADAMNVVPFEEAFIISDKESVRRLLLDALKQDEFSSMENIFQAVRHSDSEVSHYAASAISEIIDDFISTEKILRNDMYMDELIESAEKYLEYVYSYLNRHILPSDEQVHFLDYYEQAVRYFEKKFNDRITGEMYYRIIDLYLYEEDFKRAYHWVEASQKNCKDELESYKGAMKYYYKSGQRKEFLRILEALKKSDVVLDFETVEMIRFISS